MDAEIERASKETENKQLSMQLEIERLRNQQQTPQAASACCSVSWVIAHNSFGGRSSVGGRSCIIMFNNESDETCVEPLSNEIQSDKIGLNTRVRVHLYPCTGSGVELDTHLSMELSKLRPPLAHSS